MHKVKKNNIDNLIIKFLEDNLNDREIKLLKEFLREEENRIYFEKYVELNYFVNAQNKFDYHKALSKFEEVTINKPIFKLPNYFKYAAAIILLITTGYFLTKNQFTTEPAIVEINNDIPIGTDKATLTLDDGTNVPLEKGKGYENEEVTSDGEKIIYQSNSNQPNKTEEEIAYNYLTIPRGGEFYIELEDGTKVWLNAHTKLKYPVKFIDGQPREVEVLYGEAYFAVSPSGNHNGDTFKVKKDNQFIEVLGTEFNIKAYNDDTTIETTLVEGKIVLNIDDRKEELVPDQQLVYDKKDKEINIKKVDVKYITSWRNDIFMFDDMTFFEVSKILSRWYDVHFHFENENLKNLKIDGVLGKHKNIEKFLITLKNTNNINYNISENTIYIE